MLNPEGIALESKGKADILESGRLQQLWLARSPEANSLNPIRPDIVLDFVTDHTALQADKESANTSYYQKA